MNRLLSGVVDACLRLAVRRWPAELRGRQSAEWHAELYELGHEPGRPAIARTWASLRFVASLAFSSPVEDENGVPRGWREDLLSLGDRLRPVLGLVVATLGVYAAARTGQNLVMRTTSDGFSLAGQAVVSVLVLATVATAAFTGWRLGRGGRFGRRSGVAAVAIVGVTASVVDLPQLLAVDAFGPLSGALLLMGVWAAGTASLSVVLLRWRRLGPPLFAVGQLVVADLALWAGNAFVPAFPPAPAAPGFLLFPLSLVAPGVPGVDPLIAYAHLQGSVLLLGIGALVGAYTRRAARNPAGPREVAVPTSETTGSALARPRFGAALSVLSLTIWVYASASLTPGLNSHNDPVEEFHLWAQELRDGALLAAVLGVVLAVAGRGAVVVPAVVAYGGLFAIDAYTDAQDAAGATTAVRLAVLGAAVLTAAAGLARYLRPAPPVSSATAALRGVLALGVFTGPALIMHSPAERTHLPVMFGVTHAVVVALLCTAAYAAAQTLALDSWAWPRRIAVGAATVGVPATAGALSLTGSVYVAFGAALTPLLLVVLWAPRRPPRQWAVLVLAMVLAGVPLLFAEICASALFGGAQMLAAGYDFPVDGLPILPGAVLIGLAVTGMSVAAARLGTPPAPVGTRLTRVH